MQILVSSISMAYSSPLDFSFRKVNCTSMRMTSNYRNNHDTLNMATILYPSIPQSVMKFHSPNKTQRTWHQQPLKREGRPGFNGLSLHHTNFGAKNLELESLLGRLVVNSTVVEVSGVKMGWVFQNFVSHC